MEIGRIVLGGPVQGYVLPGTAARPTQQIVFDGGGFALLCWSCKDALACLGWCEKGCPHIFMGQYTRDPAQPLRIECSGCGAGNMVDPRIVIAGDTRRVHGNVHGA